MCIRDRYQRRVHGEINLNKINFYLFTQKTRPTGNLQSLNMTCRFKPGFQNQLMTFIKEQREYHLKGRDTFKQPPTSFFSLSENDIDGKLVKFDSLKGKYKALLIVNVATQ
eukprot:TRINITY_DN860_c0_g1_i8.p3 TRINITY_DN860_c0_g1~~TRINITY_DN860_c0_g1_i8.p3  ORF type:complete len:118 (-),score=31.27 TRINITY_DN860_c0_g1_i8:447-779(-)